MNNIQSVIMVLVFSTFVLSTTAVAQARPIQVLAQEVKCYRVMQQNRSHTICQVRQHTAPRWMPNATVQDEDTTPGLEEILQGEDPRQWIQEAEIQWDNDQPWTEPNHLSDMEALALMDVPAQLPPTAIPAGLENVPFEPVDSPAKQTAALPHHPAASPITPDLPPPDQRLVPKERAVLELLNQARRQRGFAPLTSSPVAIAVARDHSRDMCQRSYFDHISPEGAQPWDRLRQGGGTFKMAAENIASGYTSAEEVHQGWMDSPGHRDNRLNPKYTHVGIGLYPCDDGRLFWTELFFR